MKGKDKCKILKELRAQIAAANDIEWVTENCTHKGECRGTCPKCEAEVAMLERALERRKALGKTVAVTGLAVGVIATTTACSQLEQWQIHEGGTRVRQEELSGAMGVIEKVEEIEVDGDLAVPDETTVTSVGETSVPRPTLPDEDWVIPGEPAEIYYYTDFTLRDARTFESTESLYFEGVECDGGECSDSRNVPEGVRFEIVGETDYMWLARYEDSYYCVWKDDLDECAFEVLTDTETPYAAD